MITYICTCFFGFLLGMIIMGLLWYNSWEEIKVQEAKERNTIRKRLIHQNEQLGQIARLIDDLGSEEMKRQSQEILEW